MIRKNIHKGGKVIMGILMFTIVLSCDETSLDDGSSDFFTNDKAVFLIIDDESIDNGNEPNSFSEVDVNDQLAEVGVRTPLHYFKSNIGKQIDLFTGQVGDEGWHALKTIPSTWVNAGPTDNGLKNYLTPGPGLGAGEDDREVLLDKIPDVTPLRATGLSMLKGQTILALVYDSEISTNYSPLNGNLMGANLGLVAFDVLDVNERKDASTSSLPRMTIRIRDVSQIATQPLVLFSNAPVPESSSEPFDIAPSNNPPAIVSEPAN